MLMSTVLRISLIVCALLVLLFMFRRIKKAEINARDTTFWFLFAVCFVIIAAFPQIAFFFSSILGIESPANFIFLFVIAVLFTREFISTVETAKLREKLNTLSQEIALSENKKEKEKDV